jgi:D-serine deaminase-like pyridoxal phosphate-dependent protein
MEMEQIGTPLAELDTPAVTIDLDIVERNISRTQEFFDSHNLALRPHVKTHKIPELTKKQLAAGAAGICCQKISEAEVMIDEAGASDVFIPYNIIGLKKAVQLAELLKRPGVTITVGADSLEAAQTAHEAAAIAGRPVQVLIECDTGGKRAGLPSPQQVLELAQAIRRECDMVDLAGLFTFPTNLTETPAFFGEASRLLEAEGIKPRVLSGGGTPIQWQVGGLPYITEHRTGTYIFGDRNTLGAGAAKLEDCAMRVVATVVSRPTDERAIVDAGSKTMSGDLWLTGAPEYNKTYGLVLEYPDAVFYAQSEEHGNLDFSNSKARPAIGERVTIIPNHCCTTTNMHDFIYGVRNGAVEQVFKIAARGKVW